MPNIHGDSKIRIFREGSSDRSTRTDLLLSRGSGDNTCGQAPLAGCQTTDRFEYRIGTGFIVKSTSHADTAADQFKALIIHRTVADPYERFSLFTGGHTDIDPDMMGLRHLFSILC